MSTRIVLEKMPAPHDVSKRRAALRRLGNLIHRERVGRPVAVHEKGVLRGFLFNARVEEGEIVGDLMDRMEAKNLQNASHS